MTIYKILNPVRGDIIIEKLRVLKTKTPKGVTLYIKAQLEYIYILKKFEVDYDEKFLFDWIE